MRDASIIEIDLSAICHNMRLLRSMVGPRCAICPVVKADAYGLGAARIARCLQQEQAGGGADMLAVYTAAQASELLCAAVSSSVLILMPVRAVDRADELYRAMVCGRLHLAVHDLEHLRDLTAIADRFGTVLPLHLELDTGMSRGGCSIRQAPEVLAAIANHPKLRLAGLYTHFASAEFDEAMTDRQYGLFNRLIREHGPLVPADCLIHAANTCATIRHTRYHRSMVRIGQGWAGYGPEMLAGGNIISEAQGLQPAMAWTSNLVHIKTVEAGATVGYGATWTAERTSRIGLIPVGYADGYPLSLSSAIAPSPAKVAVLVDTDAGPVRGYAPIVGRVNMDQITIDLTDLRDAEGQPIGTPVRTGATVELITPNRTAPNHLAAIAKLAQTNMYELLCRLNPRIRRMYHQAGATVEVYATHANPSAARSAPAAAG